MGVIGEHKTTTTKEATAVIKQNVAVGLEFVGAHCTTGKTYY